MLFFNISLFPIPAFFSFHWFSCYALSCSPLLSFQKVKIILNLVTFAASVTPSLAVPPVCLVTTLIAATNKMLTSLKGNLGVTLSLGQFAHAESTSFQSRCQHGKQRLKLWTSTRSQAFAYTRTPMGPKGSFFLETVFIFANDNYAHR